MAKNAANSAACEIVEQQYGCGEDGEKKKKNTKLIKCEINII
jgi:hypothetical protein